MQSLERRRYCFREMNVRYNEKAGALRQYRNGKGLLSPLTTLDILKLFP